MSYSGLYARYCHEKYPKYSWNSNSPKSLRQTIGFLLKKKSKWSLSYRIEYITVQTDLKLCKCVIFWSTCVYKILCLYISSTPVGVISAIIMHPARYKTLTLTYTIHIRQVHNVHVWPEPFTIFSYNLREFGQLCQLFANTQTHNPRIWGSF